MANRSLLPVFGCSQLCVGFQYGPALHQPSPMGVTPASGGESEPCVAVPSRTAGRSERIAVLQRGPESRADPILGRERMASGPSAQRRGRLRRNKGAATALLPGRRSRGPVPSGGRATA